MDPKTVGVELDRARKLWDAPCGRLAQARRYYVNARRRGWGQKTSAIMALRVLDCPFKLIALLLDNRPRRCQIRAERFMHRNELERVGDLRALLRIRVHPHESRRRRATPQERPFQRKVLGGA